jgi:hypothetical protein
VPVLGAGANLCDRTADQVFAPGANLPDGRELARWLARRLECDLPDTDDLLRVSQYADLTFGNGPLYRRLHELFDRDDYPIPTLHRFIARLPSRLEERKLPRRHQLIVTTNYDNLLERALHEAGEGFDVVRYLTQGRDRGRFVHEPSDPQAHDPQRGRHVIRAPRKYDAVSPKKRTVVLKIHGGFDHEDANRDSYVITENDYIDYLTHTSPGELIPAELLDKLINSHFLFLGYAMSDWNLRVLLHRIWALRDLSWASWAIKLRVDAFEAKLWASRDVELREVRLAEYVRDLSDCVDEAIDEMIAEQASEQPSDTTD